jgi:hypothetical protein
MGIGGYAEVFQASELAEANFGSYRVLSVPALIEAKQAIGRPHDQRTVIQLRCVLDAQRQEGSSTK